MNTTAELPRLPAPSASRSPAVARGADLGAGVRDGSVLALARAVAEPGDAAERSERRAAASRRSSAAAAGADAVADGLNRRVGRAQQVLDYLQRLTPQLQNVKTSLSARLAAAQTAPADDGDSLTGQLQALSALWSQRSGDTGSSLDAALQYAADGGARQSFMLRGLDGAALDSPARETLVFSRGRGAAGMSVVLGAGDGLASMERGLAPLGLQARGSATGEPVFSVPEAVWPEVRDRLVVQGGGQRFPAGAPNRTRAEALPDAVAPQEWAGESIEQMRRSLQDVTRALEQIRRVSDEVRRYLQQQRAAVAEAVDPVRATAFAEGFSQQAGRGDYEAYRAAAPALTGLDRSRVVSLLALPD